MTTERENESEGKANLRARLKTETIANAGRDVAMAAEWFPLEEEASQAGELSRAKKHDPEAENPG